MPLEQVHVIGAGVMGADIAAWAALHGCRVTLQDRAMPLIEAALERARGLLARRLRDPQQAAAAAGRLGADLEGAALGQADVVIEAIFEDLQGKRELFAAIEPRLKPGSLLATNTSSLPLEALGHSLARPERLVGLHFFNPVAQMPLVEIVHSDSTDPLMRSAALAFARKLDKLPVPCRSAPGFIVNRVLMPYLQEALYAAQEGVPLAAIDAAAERFGMPMGPVELADVVGLDVLAHAGETVATGLGRPVPELVHLRELIALGKLGRKTAAGFYPWRDGKPVKSRETPAPPEFTDRLILVLVNECVACLREHIAADADLIDAAVLFGTGFAPFRGGPLAYARTRGVTAVIGRLQELTTRHGERFRPDPGWSLLAGSAQAAPL